MIEIKFYLKCSWFPWEDGISKIDGPPASIIIRIRIYHSA